MLLHPYAHDPARRAQSTITHVRPGDVQPNAVDVRLGRVWYLTGNFELMESSKQTRNRVEVPLISTARGAMWRLSPGIYEVEMINGVVVAEGEAGRVIPRSTLVRNGISIVSGLYDSGYAGPIGGLMFVGAMVNEFHHVTFEQNVRVAQYITFKAETAHMYEGNYGWAVDQKSVS